MPNDAVDVISTPAFGAIPHGFLGRSGGVSFGARELLVRGDP